MFYSGLARICYKTQLKLGLKSYKKESPNQLKKKIIFIFWFCKSNIDPKNIAKILQYFMQYWESIAILQMQYCTFWKNIAIPLQYWKKYCNIALQYFCNIAVIPWVQLAPNYRAWASGLIVLIQYWSLCEIETSELNSFRK